MGAKLYPFQAIMMFLVIIALPFAAVVVPDTRNELNKCKASHLSSSDFVMSEELSNRVQIIKLSETSDSKSTYLMKDTLTGKEYIGVSGVGWVETTINKK